MVVGHILWKTYYLLDGYDLSHRRLDAHWYFKCLGGRKCSLAVRRSLHPVAAHLLVNCWPNRGKLTSISTVTKKPVIEVANPWNSTVSYLRHHPLAYDLCPLFLHVPPTRL